jgi:hypothetical protein
MIDGRNLQGGLNAEPPHAECFENLDYLNLNALYIDRITSNYISAELQNPEIATLGSYKSADIEEIIGNKQIGTEYSIFVKKFGTILYVNLSNKDKYIIDSSKLIIDNSGLYFKTRYEGIAIEENIDEGKMYSFKLLESKSFENIEKLEVK